MKVGCGEGERGRRPSQGWGGGYKPSQGRRETENPASEGGYCISGRGVTGKIVGWVRLGRRVFGGRRPSRRRITCLFPQLFHAINRLSLILMVEIV